MINWCFLCGGKDHMWTLLATIALRLPSFPTSLYTATDCYQLPHVTQAKIMCLLFMTGTNKPPNETLTVVAIVIPIILSACIILSCYCFRRYVSFHLKCAQIALYQILQSISRADVVKHTSVQWYLTSALTKTCH